VIVASKSKGIELLHGCAYDGAGTTSAHAAPCVGNKTRQTLLGCRASACQPNSSSMFFRRKRSRSLARRPLLWDHDTRAIQGWLGHRSITSTAVYTALAPNRFKDLWRD
jgi:integrase